jgi:hypothetical protein
VTVENIMTARAEAERFLACLDNVCRESIKSYSGDRGREYLDTGKNSGALRRASLDLTRSLAVMRKP